MVRGLKNPPQTCVHSFSPMIPCRGVDCQVEFLPTRKDQIFCSPGCRVNFFKVARSLGAILLIQSEKDMDLKSVVDRLKGGMICEG